MVSLVVEAVHLRDQVAPAFTLGTLDRTVQLSVSPLAKPPSHDSGSILFHHRRPWSFPWQWVHVTLLATAAITRDAYDTCSRFATSHQ